MISPRPRFILTCSVASLLTAAAASVQAQTADNFTGATSSDWYTATNWDTGAVPSGTGNTGVNAFVNTGIATVNGTSGPSGNDINIGSIAGDVGRVDVTAGSLANGGAAWTFVGINGSTGTLNVANTAATGGTFTGYGTGSGSYGVGYRLFVGGGNTTGANATGTGTLNINTTGTVTVPNDMYVGGSGGGNGTVNIDAGTFNHTGGWTFIGGDFTAAGGTGAVNISGGTMNDAGDTYVGRGAGSTGTMNITGGSFNATGSGSGNLHFGFNSGTAALNLSGTGTVTATNNYIFGDGAGTTGTGIQSGAGSTATVGGQMWIGNGSQNANSYTLNGGTVTVASWVAIGRAGGVGTLNIEGGTFNGVTTSGYFDISGDGGTGTMGTVNLDGGTLEVPKVITENGTSIFNFNGGTLLLSGDGTNTVNGNTNTSFMQGLTTANVRAGGAVINTNGFNPTINQALLHSTVAGDSATTDGGLTKLGTGMLTMAAANTYLGTTTVSAGTLAISVNGGLAMGNVSVAAGATLSLGTGVTAAHNATTTTTMTLASATTSLITLSGTGVQDIVGSLVVDGVSEPFGTYGAAGSGATYTNIADFTGTGELQVGAVPEPSSLAAGVCGFGLAAIWLRRRRVV